MRPRSIIIVVALVAVLAWAVVSRLAGDEAAGGRAGGRGPAPVEVAAVDRGPIEHRRTFSGTLEARSRFVVAAHVGGRVQKLFVDLSDPVKQGQVVAELDDAEHVQTVAEAAAELAVARAELTDAEAALQIEQRELDRARELRAAGIVSQSELDLATSRFLARESAVEVAKAQVTRARAAHERARVRSGYARVVAMWSGNDAQRVVARRHVAEGDTVAAGDPLFTVVDLEPITAVVYVTEKEYAALQQGQSATVTTDAFPGRTFTGAITRIAPVFQESSRQARLEIELANEDRALKPGMFVRAEVMMQRVPDATIVPEAALTVRGGATGVFVVDDDGAHVTWRPVHVGIRQDGRVQVTGEGVAGRVVTLGQQLIDDGSAIAFPEPAR